MCGRDADSIFAQPDQRSADSLVLLYLVLRGAGSVFRCDTTPVADFAGIGSDRWSGAVSEHDGDWQPCEPWFLGSVSAVLDAVLCLELRGIGKRSRFYPDFFPESEGDSGRFGFVRLIVRPGAGAQTGRLATKTAPSA